MKSISLLPLRKIAVCAVAGLLGTGSVMAGTAGSALHAFGPVASAVTAQDTSKDQASKKPQMTDADREAAQKIEKATDVATKLKIAGDYFKKNPKSQIRITAAHHIANAIVQNPDPAQMQAQAESFKSVFKDPAEVEIINQALIENNLKKGNVDQAFQLAAATVDKNTQDAPLATQLALKGSEQVQKGNANMVQPTLLYGNRAIELLSSASKPANSAYTDAQWEEYRTNWLPILYQRVGIVYMVTNKTDDAEKMFTAAIEKNKNDALNYALLGNILEMKYQTLAEEANKMMAGPAKDQITSQLTPQIDRIIDLYAHASALAESQPQYAQIVQGIRGSLEAFYKYRHGGKLDGLQDLIAKYKSGAAQ